MATRMATPLSKRPVGSSIRASSVVCGASAANAVKSKSMRLSAVHSPSTVPASRPRSASLTTAGRGVVDRPSSRGSDGPSHAPLATAAAVPDWKELIGGIYREQCPEKLGGLDALLKFYKNEEEALYFRICERYGTTPDVSKSRSTPNSHSTFIEVSASKCERGSMAHLQCPAPEEPDAWPSLAPSRSEAPRGPALGTRRIPMQERDWFTDLFGFAEGDCYMATQERLKNNMQGSSKPTLTGKNGQQYQVGRFRTPSLAELMATPGRMGKLAGRLSVTNVVGDVSIMLADEHNRHATFQVASQFNCLEFPSEHTTPERGITGYIRDHTQGPACAIACGPATAFRNYLVDVNGANGQQNDRQINNLSRILAKLQNDQKQYLQVVNGYTMADHGSLTKLNGVLESLSAEEREELRGALCVGVQEDTQVTSCNWGQWQLRDKKQTVTQVFSSACSVSYSKPCSDRLKWEPFARLILSASYEATLLVALATALRHKGEAGSNRVYLTSLGGGVFGNDMRWIIDAMSEVFAKFQDYGLEVYIVSYGSVEPSLDALARRFSA